MRNPTRRNRNIGTAKSGFSKNNRHKIPQRWSDDRIFWEKLSDLVICPISIYGHDISLIVEPPRQGSIHASTPQDIIRVLRHIPDEHLQEIELIVLRQPKRKEELLKPVWGRFAYYADLGKYSGPGVYLESVKVGVTIKWGANLTPFDLKELDALRLDGHRVEKTKRGFDIYTTPDTVRNTQLFRTLPHEIGHSVDYLENCLMPCIRANSEEDADYIRNQYWAKTSIDKEEFANRYAKEFYQKQKVLGNLPFERLYDEQALIKMSLKPEWFNFSLKSLKE